MAWKSDKIDLRGDGRIVLYKRPGQKIPKWQVDIKVPGALGKKTLSTRTSDIDEAKRFAVDHYDQLSIHVFAGGQLKAHSFRSVFEEWKASSRVAGKTVHGGPWEETVARVERYALEFFDRTDIQKIGSKEFVDFLIWRETNFERKKPSQDTLKRERTSILALFKFAKSQRYISELPELPRPNAKSRRRPTFSDQEYKALYRNARKWVAEGYKMSSGRHRFLAYRFFLTLANTGMRIGELRKVKWSDLRTVQTSDGTSRLVATVDGKTGQREVVFQPGTEVHVQSVYDNRKFELGHHPPTDEFVFCHPNGEEISSYRNSFKSLLSFCGVTLMKDGMNRSPYSFRHFYATKRLENDTNPYLLAKQMGSSIEMIEKHYGHVISSQVASLITKGNQTSTVQNKKNYPFS